MGIAIGRAPDIKYRVFLLGRFNATDKGCIDRFTTCVKESIVLFSAESGGVRQVLTLV